MDATWLALAAVLTAVGAAWTFYAWRNRGVASAVRGAGFTLLAPAAYLTGTLELAGELAVDIGDWASGVVFSPVVWTGVALAGLGVLLVFVSGLLSARGVGTTPRPRAAAAPAAPAPAGAAGAAPAPAGRPAVGRVKPTAAPADDELDDIEAILRRRGIS